jgi:SNF2 family DNA or RNA helicase
MLDLIEQALVLEEFKFRRIDGGKSIAQRRTAMKDFSEDQNCTILLASIDCAGFGYGVHCHLTDDLF